MLNSYANGRKSMRRKIMKKFALAVIIGTFVAAAAMVTMAPNAQANACERDPTVCQ